MKEPAMYRREFLRRAAALGLGFGLPSLAQSKALGREGLATFQDPAHLQGAASGLHHLARAKRVIYLFQSGGPSQLETFDHKPLLQERNGEQLPDSVRKGQRLTGMSGNQSSLPLAGAQLSFAQYGDHGLMVSELLPHTAAIVDRLCVVRSMHTEAINHDPAITFFLTGSQMAGRPSMGGVDGLRAGQHESRPADFRCHGHERQERSASLCAPMG